MKRDLELVHKMAGSDFFDNTTLVLNKFMSSTLPEIQQRRRQITDVWQSLFSNAEQTESAKTENGAPIGECQRIVDNLLQKRHLPLMLQKELIYGKKLQGTAVGKAYKDMLKKEISQLKKAIKVYKKELETLSKSDGLTNHVELYISREVSKRQKKHAGLRTELQNWKNSKDTVADLKKWENKGAYSV